MSFLANFPLGVQHQSVAAPYASKGRPQPLILHADNGNKMRAATLESAESRVVV
jgi:hypothetical protein